MAKTRNQPTPASSSKKRRRTDNTDRVIIDTTIEEHESSNHSAEEILSSDDDSVAVPITKKSKGALKFINAELEARYRKFNLGNRKIIYGKTVLGPEFEECGLVSLFETVGMRNLIDLPDVAYPSLVQEFYNNLHVETDGNNVDYVSRVKDQFIRLNSMMLNAMLQLKGLDGDGLRIPLTKKGPYLQFDEFSELEQHCIVRGDMDNTDTSLPTTAVLDPMAHLIFKISRNNICPRIGSRSALTCQDLIIVSMLMKGKKFDVSGLILKNMMDCVSKRNRAFPYGLLLTRVFKYSGVKLEAKDAYEAPAYLDSVSLAQSSLQVTSDGKLENIPPVIQPVISTSSLPESSSAATGIQALFDKLEANFSAIQKDFAEYKEAVREVKTQNAEIKGMATELLGYFQKAKSAVRAARVTSEADKAVDQTAAKELSTPPPETSTALASGSSGAPPVNQDQAAVNNLFAD